jgi:two-component system sensor histidine kinase AlgZ
MNSHRPFTIADVNSVRTLQHVIFWLFVYLFFTLLYTVRSTFWISFHNNLYYIPVHMAYFYVLGYWLLPKYLFVGKYVKFAAMLILLMLAVVFTSRMIDIFIASPYILHNVPGVEQEFKDSVLKRSFVQKITDEVLFANAVKMMHFVVWAALGIKLLRMWYERKQAALQAELNALKAQVHPHFLFNTLNNLYALTLNNSPKSSQVVLGLSDILRYMLYECNTDKVSLKQEVLVLQQYISLEKLRYEDRLDLNFTVDGSLENKWISPLMMLPFIENAFKHGTSEKQGEVWININLTVDGNVLKFKVSNSKPDYVSGNVDKQFGHIGLQNVKKRLDLLYPTGYQLKIFDDNDAYLVVLELELSHRSQTEPQLVPA